MHGRVVQHAVRAFARRYDSMGLDIEENDVEKAPSDAMEDYLRSVRVEAGLES